MKIKETKLCTFCKHVDYVEHFVWQCEQLKSFWNNVSKCILRNTGMNVHLSERDVLFGYEPRKRTVQNKIMNHIILIAKMCISKYKYGERYDLNIILEKELYVRKCWLCILVNMKFNGMVCVSRGRGGGRKMLDESWYICVTEIKKFKKIKKRILSTLWLFTDYVVIISTS